MVSITSQLRLCIKYNILDFILYIVDRWLQNYFIFQLCNKKSPDLQNLVHIEYLKAVIKRLIKRKAGRQLGVNLQLKTIYRNPWLDNWLGLTKLNSSSTWPSQLLPITFLQRTRIWTITVVAGNCYKTARLFKVVPSKSNCWSTAKHNHQWNMIADKKFTSALKVSWTKLLNLLRKLNLVNFWVLLVDVTCKVKTKDLVLMVKMVGYNKKKKNSE